MIPSLRAGGAERVLTGLGGELAAHGHAVTVFTLMPPDEAPFYPMNPAVAHKPLGGLGPGASFGNPIAILSAARRIRTAMSSLPSGGRPRVVLGFTTLGAMLAILATRATTTPVVAAERIDPAGHGRRIGRAKTWARDTLYARADHVVVQTARAREALGWLPEAQISIIANAIAPVTGQAAPDLAGPGGRFRLIAAGRLDSQKGFDLLIPAFASLAARFPAWDLVVHGEGPQRGQLETAIAAHALQNRIRLPGVTARLDQELLAAHLLAFPSRYEGFPNALAEGLAAGLPAVGYRDVAGVEDLIVTGADARSTGLLADAGATVASLADRLAALMADPVLRRTMGTAARAHVAAFTPQIHYETWERLLTRIARRSERD